MTAIEVNQEKVVTIIEDTLRSHGYNVEISDGKSGDEYKQYSTGIGEIYGWKDKEPSLRFRFSNYHSVGLQIYQDANKDLRHDRNTLGLLEPKNIQFITKKKTHEFSPSLIGITSFNRQVQKEYTDPTIRAIWVDIFKGVEALIGIGQIDAYEKALENYAVPNHLEYQRTIANGVVTYSFGKHTRIEFNKRAGTINVHFARETFIINVEAGIRKFIRTSAHLPKPMIIGAIIPLWLKLAPKVEKTKIIVPTVEKKVQEWEDHYTEPQDVQRPRRQKPSVNGGNIALTI